MRLSSNIEGNASLHSIETPIFHCVTLLTCQEWFIVSWRSGINQRHCGIEFSLNDVRHRSCVTVFLSIKSAPAEEIARVMNVSFQRQRNEETTS